MAMDTHHMVTVLGSSETRPLKIWNMDTQKYYCSDVWKELPFPNH